MTKLFRDSVTGEHVQIADPFCEACRSTEQLVLDHDRWFPLHGGGYRRRVLCQSCNLKKGPRRWVSFADGTCWVPGMPTGARISKPQTGATMRARGTGYLIPDRLLLPASLIKRRLKERGITHDQVATEAGVHRTIVVKVLGEKAVSANVLDAARRLLARREGRAR